MRTATIAVDTDRVSPSRSLAAVARTGHQLVVVTDRMFGELERELGSPEAVARHLARVATNTGKPLAVNLASGSDTSRTIVVGPKGWSEGKTAGWVAARHAELEAAFGPATPLWEDL